MMMEEAITLSVPELEIGNSTSYPHGNVHHSHLSNTEMDALSILTLISAGLSFFGSLSVLLCSVINKRVCYPEIFPTFHLSVADMLSSIFLVVSSSLFLLTHPSYPGSSGSCGYIMAMVTTCYTSSFFLTISYALEALFRFRRRLIEGTRLDILNGQVVSNRWMYLFYALCWLIPLSFAIVVVDVVYSLKDDDISPSVPSLIMPKQCSSCFANFRFNEDYCWSQVEDGDKWHTVVRLLFLIPLMMVIVVNMVLYILIARVFRQVAMRRGLLSYHQRQEESLLRKKAVLYQSVFMICWFPSVILGILSFTHDYEMNSYYWLLLIQAILGPLQGLFNCVLYGWRRDSFRRVMSERTALLSTNRIGTICGCSWNCFKRSDVAASGREKEGLLPPDFLAKDGKEGSASFPFLHPSPTT